MPCQALVTGQMSLSSFGIDAKVCTSDESMAVNLLA